jgi:hypothetical protein
MRLLRADYVVSLNTAVKCVSCRKVHVHAQKGEIGMSRTKKAIVALLAAMTLGAFFAPIASAAPDCRPGQNANPQPGFKPGSC